MNSKRRIWETSPLAYLENREMLFYHHMSNGNAWQLESGIGSIVSYNVLADGYSGRFCTDDGHEVVKYIEAL